MCDSNLEGMWYQELCLECREKLDEALKNGEVESLFDKTPEEWGFCHECVKHIKEVQEEGFQGTQT